MLVTFSSSLQGVNNVNYAKQKTAHTVKLYSLPVDTVSFTGNKDYSLDRETSLQVSEKIRTSTSGYRALYDPSDKNKDCIFSKKIIRAITQAAAAHYAEGAKKKPSYKDIIVGGDTRTTTSIMADIITKQMLENGFNVVRPKDDFIIPTPVLALAAKKLDTNGILLSPSHNPWMEVEPKSSESYAYGGYNFVTDEATVAPPAITHIFASNVEKLGLNQELNAKVSDKPGKVKYYDFYTTYKKHLDKEVKVDWDAIRKANILIGYDGIEGTGSRYFPRLLTDKKIPLQICMDTHKKGPNPTAENMKDVTEAVMKKDHSNNLRVALSTDGDSDRFGIVDEKGNFISPTDVILLTAYHMVKNGRAGKEGGTLIRSHATSSIIDAFADNNGLKVMQTPVGFKYVGEEMLALKKGDKKKGFGPALVGGEESGGLTIKDHIPEKDGFIALLMILELMAKEQKPVGEILKNIKDNLPVFKVTRSDYSFGAKNENKEAFVKEFGKFFNGEEQEIGGMKIDYEKTWETDKELRSFNEKGDGMKIYFEDQSSILIRKSGTEPIARVYFDIRGVDGKEAEEKYSKLNKAVEEIAQTYEGKRK